MKIFRKYRKPIALSVAFAFVSEMLMPLQAFAITGHSSMPEYRSFEPVATTNMVNAFDGSFTYNIPLLEIPNGYPISLSYHNSDVNTESLSSWVGSGWTLNPGAINRIKRGFPDEFKEKPVTYHNKMEPNWTVSAGGGASHELFGNQLINTGGTIRYNNYNGIGTSFNAGVPLAGMVSLDFTYAAGRFGFNPGINPAAIFDAIKQKVKEKKAKPTTDQPTAEKESKTPEEKNPSGESKEDAGEAQKKSNSKPQFSLTGSFGPLSSNGSQFSLASLSPTTYASSVTDYSGVAVSLKLDVGVNWLPVPIAPEGSLEGSFTRQENREQQTLPVYGYMHNESALGNSAGMMDYFTENDSPYEKRDNILGIPMPNNDMFTLSGEAMAGSFRPYRSEFGHYRKNEVKSETYSVQVGADVKIPSVLPIIPPVQVANVVSTIGLNLGGDYQFLSVGTWKNAGDAANFQFQGNNQFPTSNEKFFFRFSGDLGGTFDQPGNLSNDHDDKPYSVNLQKNGLAANPVFTDFSLSSTDTRGDKRRSAHIDHSLNSDFEKVANGKKYRVAEKNLSVLDESGSVEAYSRAPYNTSGIGEYSTTNADGVNYVYGLPVHARNEKELQYSVESGQYSTTDGLIATVNTNIDASARRKLGHESASDYATTYLLTQITSPDFVDRTYNGPTTDDYGTYTRFNYQRIAGGEGDWYPYRSPYKGTNFSYGSLSIDNDDMAGVSYGEKEIYFLHSIASKTHVAIFTLEDREDGLGADLPNNPGSDLLIIGTDNNTTPKKLKKLRKIDLYALKDVHETSTGSNIYSPNAGALPLKTVNFEYDYSLSPHVENNSDANVAGNDNKGKLTLKRLWFEYNGKLTSKISPYVFDYNYPSTQGASGIDYPSAYNLLENYGGFSSEEQNPSYDVRNSDRWGNFRRYSGLLTSLGSLARFWPYVNQNNDPDFDPAAYCLKRIQLPSGGEIHIQYEQHDYMHVQDKRAMVMVPLSGNTSADEKGINDKRYYLDLGKIGITTSSYSYTEKKALVKDLFEPMVKEQQRMYFNFLYAILGNTPAYNSTNSDYLEGYARITGYGFDATGLYFTFKSNEENVDDSNSTSFYQKVAYETKASKRELPRKVCLDFFKTQRRGKITGESNALDNTVTNGSGEDLVKAFVNLVKNFKNNLDSKCAVFDPAMSYVRLQFPVTSPQKPGKLGGGVRVKRILMYDHGIEAGEPNSLYGQEYTYTTLSEDGRIISSGVASNEPGIGRRECALVNPIDKDEQTWYEAILFGRDMYSQEGPLGESLLPSPSIGYSKVTISSIHTGKTSTGTEVQEFYTWRSRPFKAARTIIDQVFEQKVGLSAGADMGAVGANVSYSRQNPFMAQGYSFVSNSMNGKLSRISKYAHGVTDKAMAEEIYEYFQNGDQIKIMDENLVITEVPFTRIMGKEAEILSEMREVADVASGGTAGVDLTFGPSVWLFGTFLVPVPSYFPTKVDVGFYVHEKILRTHVTSKIVTYPAILKRVTNMSDGVKNITENMVFDKFSGSPVLVKSYDDFKGTYLNHDFMASWNYENMRSKSLNQKVKSVGASFSTDAQGPYVQVSGACGGELGKFVKGDFIEMKTSGGALGLYHVDKVDLVNNRLRLLASQLNPGGLANGSTVDIQVISSGYTNQLNVKSGNIMTHSMNNNHLAIQGIPGLMSSALITDLNSQLDGNAVANNTSGTITLGGTYPNMNMSGYGLPSCASDPTNITVTNVQLSYAVLNNMLTLTLNSFSVVCGGGQQPVVVSTCTTSNN